MEELEQADPELSATKGTRSRIEYYFTCTPSLPLYILRRNIEIDIITYLDADTYIFSDTDTIFQELGTHSIGITGHRFPASLHHLEKYGRYNVGWLMFRNDAAALDCLAWWRQRCLDWCYDRYEDGRFADQKYLDEWSSRFPGTVVLNHPGLNAAPWNLGGVMVSQSDAGVQIDDKPLVCFHFHGFKRIWSWLYEPNLSDYQVKSSTAIRRGIFAPYILEITAIEAELQALHDGTASAIVLERGGSQRTGVIRYISGSRRWLKMFCETIMGRYLIQVNGRVL
ncbi:MAG: hypothetical protein H8K10_09740 [Nitrospira sp.]|nr:hypothetical protein [Nitrospira sp.]